MTSSATASGAPWWQRPRWRPCSGERSRLRDHRSRLGEDGRDTRRRRVRSASRGGGSWLLKPVNVGSAIKPLLAAASAHAAPRACDTRGAERRADDVRRLGFAVRQAVRVGRVVSAGLDRAAAVPHLLEQSILGGARRRGAAAGVATRTLRSSRTRPASHSGLNGQTHVGKRLHLPLDRNHQIHADTLNGSALAAGLFALDSLNTSLELAAQLGREGRDSSVWMHLRDDRFNPVRVAARLLAGAIPSGDDARQSAGDRRDSSRCSRLAPPRIG